MAITEIKCADCEQVINEDDGYAWSDMTEESYCYDCEQSDLEYPSTILKVHGDAEAQKVIFGDAFAMGDDGEAPRWFYELFKDKAGRLYKKTSEWRGHYNTVENFKDMTVLASGWTTGWADEYTTRKRRFNEFVENVCENFYGSVAPVYFLVEPTSNVFSSGVDFFCATKDVEKVTAWLDEIGHPVDTIKEWLS